MNSRNYSEQEMITRVDKAIKTDKSFCLNREVICTLPKCGGNASLRPSVQEKKNKYRTNPSSYYNE